MQHKFPRCRSLVGAWLWLDVSRTGDSGKLAEFEISELRHNLESSPKVCPWPDNSTSGLKSSPCQAEGYGCQWGGAEPL